MAASHDTAQMVRGSSGWLSRVFIYGSLLFLAAVYLLPLVVMLLTSLKPPSAVPIMLLARPALSIACEMPAFSARRFSLAMSPAGLSAPLLIFKPVLRRSRLVFSELLFFVRTR